MNRTLSACCLVGMAGCLALAGAPAGAQAPAAEAPPAAAAEKPPAQPPSQQPEERKLTFNFRFQRWIDVLEWFAEKSDLSLVLDAPPPGTFNYSDNRQYTPSEAIDLLNGVLMTKGYTLVRQERMLTVVNLAGGIPDNLIPQVKLEDLDRRGKYEFVKVQFPLGGRPAAAVVEEIKPLLSKQGKSVALAQTGQLLVTDTAGVMRAVDAVIQSIPVPQPPRQHPPAEKPVLAVYPLKTADPATALEVLKALFPGATIALDPQARQINAFLVPSQQAAVQGILEKMQADQAAERRPRLEVYRVGEAGAAELVKSLAPLAPGAKLSASPMGDQLIAYGTPEEHEALKQAVERLGGRAAQGEGRQAQVYRLTRADAAAAITSLGALFPRAKFAADAPTRSLIAVATPEEHAQIQALVAQLDRPEALAPALEPRTYPLSNVDGTALLTTLQALFALRSEVRFSLDATNHKLLALASPEQHETIGKVVAEAQRAAAPAESARVEFHPLGQADPATVQKLVEKALGKQAARAEVSVDAASRQLVVIAEPQLQEQVRAVLAQLQGAAVDVDVLPLDVLDPATAQAAINDLFSGATGAPKVSVDAGSGQLLARGSAEQLARIRQLLVKMGETSLARPGTAGSGRKLRVVPIAGDARSALEELQRVWPKLRGNAIEVVTPSAIAPKLREQSPPPPAEKKSGCCAEQPSPPSEPPPNPQPSPPPTRPPILVAPSGEGLLIASEDLEALDQFEALARALTRRGAGAGREFAVFTLRIASAATVTETLERLFASPASRSGTGAVLVVPDDRLNAVIVHAPRADRAAIERLIELLDAPNAPESLSANKPAILPVKNTKAAAIERVLRDVYETQLRSGGGRRAVPIPTGISSEMADLIRQVNAAVSAPQMSLSVDEVTNSLVVMAAPPLVAEVTKLVETLDSSAAVDPARAVEIVPLQKANIKRIEDALDALLKEGIRRRSRSDR